MASKKIPVVHVAVCGLTSSSFPGMSGEGAGKSCLCNRFVRPKRDDLCLNHSSIMTNSDFGSSVVNNGHFLYWGEKITALEDGSIAFQIVEHTEFVEDGNLQLYPFVKPYHKRCIQQKLVSGGKVQYLHPDQLAVPDEYTNVGRFPEKFVVDGYIICVDVSENLSDPQSQQREFLGRLLPAIMSVKKAHIVVAYTKFDIAKESSVTAANEILARCKRQVTIIEVSALEAVNVDVCFLVLAHLVDSKRPRTKIPTFTTAFAHLKERVRKNEGSFQTVLSAKIIDFSLPLSRARALLENEVEFLVLRELRGKERVDRLIKAQLKYLKEGVLKAKITDFIDHLRASLQIFLQKLSLNDTHESCKKAIITHEKFSAYFVENMDWRDDVEFLKQQHVTQVPFSILDEPEGTRVLQEHMDKVLAGQRAEVAAEVISAALHRAQYLIPGTQVEHVLEELGLTEQLKYLSYQLAQQIFKERMAQVEQDCVSDIIELLLENPQLFSHSEVNALSTINAQLKDDRRYQRLELHENSRMSAIIKHIGVMKWPDKSPFALSPILDRHTLHDHGAPSQELLSQFRGLSDQNDDGPSSNSSNWSLNMESRTFNLAILGRTEDNSLTLRSDFMNHMSGSGTCDVLGMRYKMQLSVHHGNITTLNAQTFTPQGVVAVVNSKECLSWLEQTLSSLWIPGGNRSSPYHGLPLVILALDNSIMDTDASSTKLPDTKFCKRAKELADMVQCIIMIERPTVQPKRLVLTSVISPLLCSLLDSVNSYSEFLNYDLTYNPKALNVAVFTLAGDPYSPLDLLSPWLRHQAVCTDEKGMSLFINCPLERQHSVVNLTFNSSLNILNVKKKVYAGFMLVYSPQRQASFAILKHLMSQLSHIPMLIVAMVNDDTCDNRMIEDGEKLAQQYRATFIASNTPRWKIGCTTEFFTKCWFSRFTSWQTQNFNPRGNRDRPLPQPIPGNQSHSLLNLIDGNESSSLPSSSGPTPPPSTSDPSCSLSPNRPHSIAGLLDPPVTSPPPPSITTPPPYTRSLPRPTKPKLKKTEEQIYSDPADIAMGTRQKKASLQRRQERDKTLPRTPGSGPISPNQHLLMMHLKAQSTEEEDNAYADPKDILQFHPTQSKNEPAKGPMRSPSVSPPPPPPASPPMINGDTKEELYDTVQPAKTTNTDSTQPGGDLKKKNYDHLTRQTSKKYDHLTEDAAEWAGEQGERPPVPLPNESPRHRPPLPKYSTVQQDSYPPDDIKNWSSSPPEREKHVATKKKKAITIVPVAGGNGRRQDDKRPPIPSPTAVTRGNLPSGEDTLEDHLYAVVNTATKKRNRTPPPLVLPKPHLPSSSTSNGGDNGHSGVSRRSHDRQRQPTKPLVASIIGGNSRYELDLSSESSNSSTTEQLYAMPVRKAKKPPVVAPKPLPRRSPSPIPPNVHDSNKYIPRGKSFDYVEQERKLQLPLSERHIHKLDPRMRTVSDPFFNKTVQERGDQLLPYGKRAESSDNVWGGGGDNTWDGDDTGITEPILPERRYSPAEMGLEGEPPPLPPRNYDWSDVEDNDEDLFQSEDELEEYSSRISLDDQQAMYSSLRLYQKKTNSMSGIEELYAIVNQVAKEQEATQNPNSQYQFVPNEEANVYDTLENALKQKERLKMKSDVTAAMKDSVAMGTSGDKQSLQRPPTTPTHSALGAIGGAGGAAMFTPKQLKLIKQQQKLLDKLQKKTEREAERRRRSEVRRKKGEEGRKKGKRNKSLKEQEQQRYFGSPLEKVVEADGVPRFIKQCTQIIETDGLKIEGIYRVSGKKDACLDLQDQYDMDSQLDVASLGLCETAISSTLKAFFKLLPEPLISNSVASAVLDVNETGNFSEQKSKLEQILQQMPSSNLSTLRYLMFHLHKVQQLRDINKMSSSNLAIVFWPTLLRPPLSDLANPSKQLCWQLVMARLIEHPDVVPEVC